MSNNHLSEQESSELIFDDPIGYLAQFGIEAQLVAETTMPAAA